MISNTQNAIITNQMAKLKKSLEKHIPVSVFVEHLLQEKLPNSAILRAVQRKYPESKADIGTISFYRKKARRKGLPIPTSTEAKQLSMHDQRGK